MDPWPVVFGIIGGMLGEVVTIIELRQTATSDWPIWAKMRSYWMLTGVRVLIGGLLVFVHQNSGAMFTNNALLAVNIGATAPLVIKQFRTTPGPHDASEVN